MDKGEITSEVELLHLELRQRTYATGWAIDLLWQEIILAKNPDYGDWDYAAQAYRHIKAEFDELLKERNEAMEALLPFRTAYHEKMNEKANPEDPPLEIPPIPAPNSLHFKRAADVFDRLDRGESDGKDKS